MVDEVSASSPTNQNLNNETAGNKPPPYEIEHCFHRRGGYYPIDGNLRDKKSEEGKGVEGRNIKRNLRKQSAK